MILRRTDERLYRVEVVSASQDSVTLRIKTLEEENL